MVACACGIDVHAHVIPHDFPSYIGAKAPTDWPSMAPAQACHRSVMIAGKVYRTVSDKCWDTAKRLEDLPGMGPGAAGGVADAGAAVVLDARRRRAAVAALPQRPDRCDGGRGRRQARRPRRRAAAGRRPAIRELEYVVKTLGFPGVEVGSNINGVPIGAPQFDPFFEACEALGAAVFVHAIRPAGMERLVGPAPLQQVIAYPGDVGLAAASVITSNLMVRRPKLRIAFSHGGGTLGLLLPRLQQGWGVFPALQESVSEAPVAQARKLFYDTLVFDAPALRYLTETFGSDQLLAGTDYPFNFHERKPVERIEAAGFDADTIARLVHRNAERFLGLKANA
ncbi:amidohydrolase family protein [Ramlibacter terrae]|uniref:Amidohydrolase family protein n=1 Tax=Ramlibacter terrae TaxID=2732511 RepID=A0ABX6P1D9_9BURK|nr:amidohydrolase family protein [Ramlibacter terrae]